MAETKRRAEVEEWIRSRVRQQPHCKDFNEQFRLLGNGPGWTHILENRDDWSTDCLEAFSEAVAAARKKFEISG